MKVVQQVHFTVFFFCMCLLSLSCSYDFREVFIRDGIATSSDIDKRQWTVMMYMAADNNLEGEAIKDINELESLNLQSKGITILSLLDRSVGHDGTNGDWSDTRLYEIMFDEDGENGVLVSKELASKELALTVGAATELDMASANTLKSFLQFGYSQYKAENYALIIWGHGNGWRSITFDNYTNTTMSLPDFSQALKDGLGDNPLHVLAFDTSFGATIEILWEIKDYSQFFVGSSGVVSSAGWKYKEIFSAFTNTGQSIDDFTKAMGSQEGSTIVHLQNVQEVKNSFDGFTRLVAEQIDSVHKQRSVTDFMISEIDSYHASSYPSDMFLDMEKLVLKIVENASVLTDDMHIQDSLVISAENVQTSLQKALVTNSKGQSSISIFFVTLQSKGVPDASYPDLYVYDKTQRDTISFVNEHNGWTPTKDKSVTLLNKLFFSIF